MPLKTESDRWIVDATHRDLYTIALRRGTRHHGVVDLLARDDVRKWLVVIDATVQKMYGETLPLLLDDLQGDVHSLVLSVSEDRKNFATVEKIVTAALDAGLYRRDEIIGIGGGVLCDVVGLAAAVLRKGTSYSLIPTTLVADVDAALGFKRMVNFEHQPDDGSSPVIRKSMIGDYHPPRITIIDPDFLQTLPELHLRAGLAEMKKVGEMACPDLFAHLETHGRGLIDTAFQGAAGDRAIHLAVTGIMEQIADDPRERDLERWPDHGHSISPTLEIETGLPHGLAVNVCASLGAVVANARRENGRPVLSDESLVRMLALSATLRLPTWHQKLAEPGFLARAAAATARVRGGDHWPVPTEVGSWTLIEPTTYELEAASDFLRQYAESISDGES